MPNRYSAQHVSAYLIGQLNEQSVQINGFELQQLLKNVDRTWRKVFGQCAFSEQVHPSRDYYIEDVFNTYKEQFGDGPIDRPAMEWYLPYGQFQLCLRPYTIPTFSPLENVVISRVVSEYLRIKLKKIS